MTDEEMKYAIECYRLGCLNTKVESITGIVMNIFAIFIISLIVLGMLFGLIVILTI